MNDTINLYQISLLVNNTATRMTNGDSTMDSQKVSTPKSQPDIANLVTFSSIYFKER